jgi:hypothetical protein
MQQGESTVLLTERHAQDYVIGRRGTGRDGLELKTNKAMRHDWRKLWELYAPHQHRFDCPKNP